MIVQKTKNAVRCAALFLAVLFCGLALGSGSRPARAADWMEPYLEQVVEWGIMRGDSSGNLNADREITRAEFVTLINRAFGYTDVGPNPFSDVLPTDWFAEDIAIAHQAGYFNGTTPTTASPLNYVTREQAAALLGRSLRLKGAAGSNTSFEDGNQIGTWSRSLVQEAADLGIIQGYSDGTFRPMERITRGQVACFLVRALGTLINEPGEQTAGGVYGNLTINTAGVKLKDTTITGNLYLTGGVGLGNVELENVNVLGKIVLCGAGEAEKGENSVVLRNVIADSFEVDSLTDQFLTVRAEGLTDIGTTTVRTPSYIEDVTDDGLGLRLITLDGVSGTQLQLAGNIKEVHNITPNSDLQIVQGVAHTVTMDEKATGGRLNIDNSATIRDLNLDTATAVTGTGSISHANVNAAGSNIATLPDTITVRPGINSNVHGQNMDSVAAAESSEDPRLLSGYPAARDVAPTTANAVFSTNKTGTIHWAVTTLTDGSLGEEELMNPSAYSARILRNGTLNAAASNTEYTARLTGLTRDGSYYISALLVDARGRRSPVKVTAFTTPDDSVPAFAAGYPYTIMTTDEDNEQVVQAMVMATKDCQLYYALLPNNSSAPTQADLKAAAVTGNLGYGVVDVKKNTPLLIPKVNTSYLEEQATYSLYLWLNDADNGRSSAIRRLQVTTLDKTPPTITSLTFQDAAARTATFTVTLDEPGTLYWAVVKANTQFYASVPGENRVPSPEETVAKIQIENGTNADRRGNVNVARAATEVRFTISGLEAQTHYDLYYVAKDRAGNYNIYTESYTPPMEFSTLDNIPPTVEQEFTHDGTDEGQRNPTPYPDTDINLVFSEMVQRFQYVNGVPEKEPFLDLYNAVDTAAGAEAKEAAKDKLAEALRKCITLWQRPARGEPFQVPVKGDPGVGDDDWVIDYREVIIRPDPEGTGEMILTFLNNTGLRLTSGATYYFTLENIADTSQAANRMVGTRGIVTLPAFTTIDAQLLFSTGEAEGIVNGSRMVFDMYFGLIPVTASNVSSDSMWDMIFWSNDYMTCELYSRRVGETDWDKLPGQLVFQPDPNIVPREGVSVTQSIFSSGKDIIDFEQLNSWGETEREFGIMVTSLNGVPDTRRNEWTGSVSITVLPLAGELGPMRNLAEIPRLTPEKYDDYQRGTSPVREIGSPREQTVTKSFRDMTPPYFISGTPTIVPGDTGALINIMLNRDPATYYYVVAPIGHITTVVDGQNIGMNDENLWRSLLPESGVGLPVDGDGHTTPNTTEPVSRVVTNPNRSLVHGSGSFNGTMETITINHLLEPETKYIAYFVLQGESQESTSNVYAIRFETKEVDRPSLSVSVPSPDGVITADGPATIYYAMVTAGTTQPPFSLKLSDCGPSGTAWDSLTDAQRAEYGNLSVLEAMRRSGTGINSGASLFDLYANPNNRNVQDIITIMTSTGSSGGSIPHSDGPITLQAPSYTLRRDLSEYLTGTSQYWLVAIGQNAGSSSWAFRSNSYLQNVDRKPPQVTSITTTIETTTQPEPGRFRYNGTVTIIFNEPLYYLPDRSEPENRQKVVDKSPPITDDSLISSINLISQNTGSAIFTVNPSGSDGDCTSLTISFSNCSLNSTITFSGSLCDSQSNLGSQPLALSLQQLLADADPQFEFPSTTIANIWDGRNLRN